jgi:hypothetical protein
MDEMSDDLQWEMVFVVLVVVVVAGMRSDWDRVKRIGERRGEERMGGSLPQGDEMRRDEMREGRGGERGGEVGRKEG